MKNATSCLALLVGSGAALTASAADKGPSAPLEEVLVTASKRQAANIQDVPYNISALSGGMLEKTGVTDLSDFARVVPGLSMVDTGANNKQIVIRGLAASAGTEQVSVYFDEIPTSGIGGTNVAQTDVRLYDVERIEVLRGPQGTLYGSGSQAGTIRYIMNKPRTDAFEGSVDGGISFRGRDGGERLSANAMVNVPLVQDRLAIRAVGYHRRADGLVDLPDLGIDGSDEERTSGGRILAQLDLTPDSKLSAAAYYQDTELDDQSLVSVNQDARPGLVRTPFEDRLGMYNLTLEQGTRLGTLTATTSLFKRHTFYSFDVSQFVPTGSARVNQPADTDAASAEMRFASELDGAMQFVVGAFYQERERDSDSYGAFIDESTGELPDNETRFFHNKLHAESTNRALFGEVTYDVSDRLALTAGARAFELERDSQNTLLIDFFGNPLGPEPRMTSEVSDVIYRFQASYDINDDVLAYVTYSEGFREGGENGANLIGNLPRSFDPDMVNNYEVGWKSELLERQLVLNGALYYMEWQDIQVSRFDDTGAFTYTSNAGEAELYGIELEGSLRPDALPGFSATFGVRYSEQQLVQDNPNALAGDEFAGRKGDRIPQSFPWQANAGLEQRFSLGQWPAYARVDLSYTGEARTTFNPADPQSRVWGDFVLTDLRLGIEEDVWTASLFARNVFNKRAPVNWSVQTVPGIPDFIFATQPREIGVQLSRRF